MFTKISQDIYSKTFTQKSYAKVNLFLHVLGKLESGYHSLESLVIFPQNYYDEISVCLNPQAEQLNLAQPHQLLIAGKYAHKLKDYGNPNDNFLNNIIAKSVQVFEAEFGVKTPPLIITLTKNLWVAAGIGGGSGNAAAMLRILSEIHSQISGLKVSTPQLAQIAIKIGADVPVCVYSQPAIFSGIGEQVQLLQNFPELKIDLQNPEIAVDTPQIFKMGFQTYSNPIDFSKYNLTTIDGVFDLLNNTKNDLQPNAEKLCPQISSLLADMQASGSFNLTRMSGSGATCFGL